MSFKPKFYSYWDEPTTPARTLRLITASSRFVFSLVLLITLALLTLPAEAGKGMAEFATNGGGGSAVCVGRSEDNRMLLLTCKHIVQNDSGFRVKVRDQWYPCTLVGTSPKFDLAMIATAKNTFPTNSSFPEIANAAPEKGDRIHIAGYGGPKFGNTEIRREGVIKDYTVDVKQRQGENGPWVAATRSYTGPVIDQGIFSGDSGGGYFNECDQLVGIVTGLYADGKDRKRLRFVSAGDIRVWYEECQWNCPPGQRCPTPQSFNQQYFQPQPTPAPNVTPPRPSTISSKEYEVLRSDQRELARRWKALDDQVQALLKISTTLSDKTLESRVLAILQKNPSPNLDGRLEQIEQKIAQIGSGPPGEPGPGLVRLWIAEGRLKYELTDGKTYDAGLLGKLSSGTNSSISSARIKDNKLYFKLENGKEIETQGELGLGNPIIQAFYSKQANRFEFEHQDGSITEVPFLAEGLLSRLDTIEQRLHTLGQGSTESQGPAGTVTVIIHDSGEEQARYKDLQSGSTVVVDITRFLEEDED